MELQTLNDIIPGMKTGEGIFSAITNPMWEDYFTASQLDIFFAANYGHKHPTYYAEAFVNSETGIISGSDLTALANSIYNMRATEWSQLFAILTAEYDPLANTEVTETITETKSGSSTDGNTRTLGNTSTRTLNTTTGNSGTGSSTSTGTTIDSGSQGTTGSTGTDNGVFGFDSSTEVGSSTSDTSISNTVTTSNRSEVRSSGSAQNSNTETNTGTITDADTGTITDAGSNSFSETFSHNLHKVGNIGVMSNVALLKEGQDFYHTWSFVKQICEDICQFIALSVY